MTSHKHQYCISIENAQKVQNLYIYRLLFFLFLYFYQDLDNKQPESQLLAFVNPLLNTVSLFFSDPSEKQFLEMGFFKASGLRKECDKAAQILKSFIGMHCPTYQQTPSSK
jgi:hypothetical protein